MKSIYKVICAMLIWGTVGICVRVITLPSTELVFMRSLIGSLSMLVFKLLHTKGRIDFSAYSRKNLLLLVVSGAVMAFHWMLLFESFRATTVANATILCYTAPVFVVLLSPLILKEKLTAKSILGVGLSMAGLMAITLAQPMEQGAYNHPRGFVLGLASALLYVVLIFLNKFIVGFPILDRSIIQIGTSALTLLPFVLTRRLLILPADYTLIVLLVLGAVHTGFAYILYFGSFDSLPAQTLSILSYIDPISATFFGALLLAEPIGLPQLLGGALVLLGTALPILTLKSNKKNPDLQL